MFSMFSIRFNSRALFDLRVILCDLRGEKVVFCGPSRALRLNICALHVILCELCGKKVEACVSWRHEPRQNVDFAHLRELCGQIFMLYV